jgi:hypothetical protein
LGKPEKRTRECSRTRAPSQAQLAGSSTPRTASDAAGDLLR